MTLTKKVTKEIENALNEVSEKYNEAHSKKDYEVQNDAYQRFSGMMKIVRLLGYDLNCDDGEDIILRIEKIS